MNEKTRICFVCLGNIVRSPVAENLFRKLANEAGVGDRYTIDSAGTGSWHVGEAPDPRMRRVAAERGLNYAGRARRFERRDFSKFDYVIAMDQNNQRELFRLTRSDEERAKIHLMREFDPASDGDLTVPDPYYGGTDGFVRTYAIIERACAGLLKALQDGRI